jgi:hypothetical protein
MNFVLTFNKYLFCPNTCQSLLGAGGITVIKAEISCCYSFDLVCSPKAHVFKAWSPLLEVMETLRGGA